MAPARVIAERFREKFGDAPDVVASAPGRVNLVGEHTDYNDGFVLPIAIDRRIHVAVSARPDDRYEVAAGHDGRRYVEAVARILRAEGLPVPGANVFVSGDVPIGAGLSSSAALEVSVARALCALARVEWSPMTMARFAQRAENEVLGVRCGIMDQVASAAGRPGSAMLLDCRSLSLTYVAIPTEVAIVVMDTGVRRALSETEYNERRDACERAVRAVRAIAPEIRALRDVESDMLERAASALDSTALQRAVHVVAENARPALLADALRTLDFVTAGRLMNDSHASLRDLYEVSSTHLDVACDAARAHVACYGARMTGAGFGGCAIALVRSDATREFIGAVQPQYEARTYKKSDFFVVTADEGARLES